jgi:polar amino acid transport system permease protein
MDWVYVCKLFGYLPFWQASLNVIALAVLSWSISVVLGMFVALGKQSRVKPISWLCGIYVWFFRSLPLLVLLIFVYNAPAVFPELKTVIGTPFLAGLVALVLSETAYISEIHRGGLKSVSVGQIEAAQALGLGWFRVEFGVVVPQAIRVALPSLANELVVIIKMTSLVSSISMTELLLVGQRLYTRNFKVLETLLVVAVFYVMLVTIFDGALKLLERRLDVTKRKREAARVSDSTAGGTVGEMAGGSIGEMVGESIGEALDVTRPHHPHEGEPLIAAKDVHKKYGATEVLKGIDLTVHRGEVVAIIGPSGSGKTTFIRTMNGLEPINGGDLLYRSQPIGYRLVGGEYRSPDAHELAEQREEIGMVFQQFNLFPHMTVLENVVYAPLKLNKIRKTQSRNIGLEYLGRVGLAEHADKYPHQLSGGQQQRVAIARALAMKPEMVLFDEPTSALDPELVGEVLATMTQLAQDGLTMVVVTHEMRFARKVADWVVFMEAGKIIEQGESERVFNNPQTERLRQFLSQNNT